MQLKKAIFLLILFILPIASYAELNQTKPLPKSEQALGYQKTNDNVAKFLLEIKSHAPQEIRANTNSKYGIYDTHLKHHYSDIKLAFPFKGIGIPERNVIGYAAVGSFIKKDEKEGWNAIKTFFNEPKLGVCSYAKMSILAVQLTPEDTKELINDKPSTKAIEGNLRSGFLYSINWYTDNSISTLECANPQFDKLMMDKMKALAMQIDHATE